jgi:uncharacterized membrane protein
MLEWAIEKFVIPLCRYYTAEATVAYGLALAVAVYLIYRLLQRLKIQIDRRFTIAVLPFIIFGGWVRALRDHAILTGWWFCSPPIYFIISGIALGALGLGLLIQRHLKFPYYKAMAGVGLALILSCAMFTVITNWPGLAMILAITAGWAVVFFGFSWLKPRLLSLENAGITAAHLLDASATFTAMSFFGYYEQHVLPTFLIGLTGPSVMFPLKIAVVLGVLLALDRWCEDRFFRNFLKIVILILGLALGIRGLLTVSMLAV